ncbi:MAG: hypothetical protein JST57_08955 [Bacteroidetes bacterium]|nr:hypothetical protein [Bacteroidota bacterium]MBS1926117.1 hypothetical protein [Bacteroidota bacterium]
MSWQSSLFLFLLSIGTVRTTAAPLPSVSTQQQANLFLDSIKTISHSPYWTQVSPGLFLQNLKTNITHPENIYPGRSTNFCAFGVVLQLVAKQDPLGYAKFMLQLYTCGKSTFHNICFQPPLKVREAAGNLRFKGVLDINHAEQIWFLTLADHFKGYLNFFNRNYDPGDEDTFWAATNLKKFNKMTRAITGFKTTSAGSDLIHPRLKNTVAYLQNGLSKGVAVLYINNRILHKKNHEKVKFATPTHFVILEKIEENKGTVTLVYWDSGGYTLRQMSTKIFRKILFGITLVTANEN